MYNVCTYLSVYQPSESILGVIPLERYSVRKPSSEISSMGGLELMWGETRERGIEGGGGGV